VCGGWQDPEAEHHVKGRFLHAHSLKRGAKPFEEKSSSGLPEPRHGAFEVQVAFMTPEGARDPNGQDCGDRYGAYKYFSTLGRCGTNKILV